MKGDKPNILNNRNKKLWITWNYIFGIKHYEPANQTYFSKITQKSLKIFHISLFHSPVILSPWFLFWA